MPCAERPIANGGRALKQAFGLREFSKASQDPGEIADVDRRGTGTLAGMPSMYSPVLDVGKGFGDLPSSMNLLRPLAITAQVSSTTPGQAIVNGTQFATTINYPKFGG